MKGLSVVNDEEAMTPVQTVVGCTLRERGLRLPGSRGLSRCDFDREYVERLVSEDPEIERHFTRYFGDLLSLKLRSKLRAGRPPVEAGSPAPVFVLPGRTWSDFAVSADGKGSSPWYRRPLLVNSRSRSF